MAIVGIVSVLLSLVFFLNQDKRQIKENSTLGYIFLFYGIILLIFVII